MQRHISLSPAHAPHRAGTPRREEVIPSRAGASVTASLISLQRVIGNTRVLQLLRAESPLIGLTTVSGRVQRDGYGLDEGWGDVKATDADYGSSQSAEDGNGSTGSGYSYGLDEGWGDAGMTDAGYGGSQSPEYGASSESGYGYGTDEGWGDATTTDAGYGGSQSPEYGGGSSESGYGYEFGDDPLAAGGFGDNEYF